MLFRSTRGKEAMLDSSCSLFLLASFPLVNLSLFIGLRDSHRFMQIPSGIGVMLLAYSIVNFTLPRTCMKLTGLIESSASLYVRSLFLPKNTLVISHGFFSCISEELLFEKSMGKWHVNKENKTQEIYHLSQLLKFHLGFIF